MGTEFKLTASVPVALEDYGSAVAVSGDYAIVGARDGGFGPGSAYVYVMRGSGWTQQAKLNASDPKGLGHFGAAVSIDGDYAVIGAPDNGSHSEGRAYIFHRSGTSWNEQARLVASDMTRFGAFGRSVSMSDDAAIVGADRAAYVFRRAGSTWTEEAKLAAPPPVTNAGNFGVSVSISGDHAIVGDALGGAVAPNQGAAYVFRRAGASWDFQTPLTAVDGGPYDYFGWSVSISGDAAIVGAHDATSGGVSKAGGAYVFERSGSTWLPQAKLEPLGPHVVKDFCRSVAIRGSYAVVGDPADFDTFPGGGAAYVFKKSGGRWWMAGSKLVEPAPKLFDWFGQSVAISATHVIVGAPEATDAESHQGVAYLHQLPLDLGDFSDQYVMFATILFGLISGGGGVIIRPGSGPVPVDPEPFRTWMSLPASKQDMLVGLALGEIASLIHDEGTKERVKRAGLDLTKKAAARLAAPDRAQPKRSRIASPAPPPESRR